MTYGELKTLVESYLHRSDLTDSIATFTTLAQARINRDLKVPEMVSRATFTLEADDRYIPIPADAQEFLNVQVPTSAGRRLLMQLSPGQMDVTHESIDSGIPTSYCLYGDQMELIPVPSEAMDMEIVYRHAFTTMTTDSETNDLLTRCPNIYIYASMLEATPFIQADERAPMWKEYYLAEVESLNEMAEDLEYSGTPIQILNLGTSTP